mgnify:CR=1 FL=1
MYPDQYWNRQRGAGLPIALFIITVLALIVTSMAQQQESTGAAVSQQILSQRAFYEDVYTLVSTGQCGVGTEQATREIEVRVR